MAIAFSRTMRSLDADDFRGPKVVWLFAMAILAAWMWWFFTAQIPMPDGPPKPGAEVQRITPARLAWRAIQRVPESTVPQDSSKQ